MESIAVLIHTRNSQETLGALLKTVQWAEELIAIDMASSDDTQTLLSSAGATVFQLAPQPWTDELRNPWLTKVKSPWTLVLDSDEYLSEDAETLIRQLIADAPPNVTGFALPRFNYCFGRVLQGERWYPDHQLRLFRSQSIKYVAEHHRAPEPVNKGKIVALNPDQAPHIHHQHYQTVEDFIARQIRYAITDDYKTPMSPSQLREKVFGNLQRSLAFESDEERALEVLLAWDVVVRGLIAWDRSGRSAPLPPSYLWSFPPHLVRLTAIQRLSAKLWTLARRAKRALLRQNPR